MKSISAARVIAALAVVAVFAACNSTPVATLKDPVDVATRAAASLHGAKAIHARFSATGSFSYSGGAISIGSGPGSFSLDGTTGQAWFDTRTENARLTFSAPGFAASSGELIRVGNDAYVKLAGGAQLLMGQTGDKYAKFSLGSTPVPVPSSAAIDQVGQWLASPGVVLLGVEKKNGRDSYHLRTTVPQAQLSEASKMSLNLGAVVADVWVAVDNQQVTHVELTANGNGGAATLAADFDYPGSVTIQAPSADKVAVPAGLP